LVGKSEGKRPPGGTRRRWEDNIKMDHQEVGMDYTDMAKDRDSWWAMIAVINHLIP
jgi:hypothetical protein